MSSTAHGHRASGSGHACRHDLRARPRLQWLLPLALLAVGDASPQGPAKPAAPLEPGKIVECELAGGQWREFLVGLKADEYARVAVDQRSVDVAVTVFRPDGEQLFAVNDVQSGEEGAEWIARQAGAYRVRILAVEQSSPPGRCAVTLQSVEPATERLAKRIAAARAFSQGMASWAKQTPEGALKGADSLLEALAHSRAAQDRAREANVMFQLSLLYTDAGNKEKALDFAARAVPVARAAGDRRAEAWAFNALGHAHNSFGDKRKAVEHFQQSLPLMRAAADQAGEAAVLNNLGTAYSRLGQKRRALEHFEPAAKIYRDIQDRRRLAIVTGNIGATYAEIGEYQRALDHHQTALAVQRELSNRKSEGIALNNIGAAYSSLAEYQKALDSYTAALQIYRSLDLRWNSAVSMHNIGWVYATLGDRARALEYYQQALGILREVKDQWGLGNTLNNLGEIHAANGNHRKALETFSEALALRRAAGHADGEATTLGNIAGALAKLGETDTAREHLERAVAILRVSGDRRRLAATLQRLGALHREQRNQQRALDCLDEALEIARAIREKRREAETLAELARVEQDRNAIAQAQQRAGAALAAFESLRLTLASPALRASFFAAARGAQELNVELLMRLHGERPRDGFKAMALLATERGRARSLLELLAESGVELREGAAAPLVARERELERFIAGKAEQQTRMLSRKHSEAEAAAASKELDALAAELDQVQSRIREGSPRYAALTRPRPLNLDEIQLKILDENTLLLEFALGPSRSYLWAVTPASVDVYELPGRSEIESCVRRVRDLLTARNQNAPAESPAARAARIRQADRDYLAAAARASRMLLAPAVPQLGQKRLLIVAEGILNYLSFAALPDPNTNAANSTPLIVNHEIVTAPSASVLAGLRREAAGRRMADKTLAVLADPVFSADDARILRRPNAASAGGLRSEADGGASRFARLRFTRVEAEAIVRLAKPGATMKALDFDASREAVLSPDFGRYRIVHFATHSLLDNERPELSGVVLSLVNQSGRPQNGFLRLYDIYNLRLGADLVVLSACQTALGREIKGEGLIGLTRGFFYAGARRVVASLWETDDRTAAELMKLFYEGILVRNERPAAALRSAQVATWKRAGWEQPYFWAPFVLQGEWQ